MSAAVMPSSHPSTPPRSRNSMAYRAGAQDLTLDLSDLPGLQAPSPPSNTILITNLDDLQIFSPPTLAHLRELINKHTSDDIFTFSPIRSFRRIIVTFFSISSAVAVRTLLDGEPLFNSRMRIYFGEQTPISPTRHLAAPKADKQFFISPPPSPPHGWEVREEEPPNREVHAEDLVVALERLNARSAPVQSATSASYEQSSAVSGGRKRSSSTIVFDPQASGNSPDLPAIAVEDTTTSPEPMSPSDEEWSRGPMPRTERPPTDFAFGR